MNKLTKFKPKQPSRCQCINPLYSFPVCAQCKKVIYNLENQSNIRKRTVQLSIELTRLMNDYQTILESYDKQNPQIFISMKTQFLEIINSVFEKAFHEENNDIKQKEQLDQQIKTQKKYDAIINEIICTEKDYNKDINLIIQYYLLPLEKHFAESNEFYQFKQLLNEMKNLSNEFLQTMEKKENIMIEIEKHIDELHCYADYFVLYHKYCKTFESLRKDDEFDQIKQTVTELRQLDIMDMLVKPFQRLTKYPLFMKEIKPLLVSIDTIEIGSRVEKKLQQVLSIQNEKQRKYLSKELIGEIEPKLIWKKMNKAYSLSKSDVCLVLVTENISIKHLTTKSVSKPTTPNISEKKPKEKGDYTLLTFTDFILFGKSYKGKISIEKYIELSKCTVDTNSLLNECQMILHDENESYLFSFNSFADKNLWINKFEEIPHKELNDIPLVVEEIYPIPTKSGHILSKSQSFSRIMNRNKHSSNDSFNEITSSFPQKACSPLIQNNSYRDLHSFDSRDDIDNSIHSVESIEMKSNENQNNPFTIDRRKGNDSNDQNENEMKEDEEIFDILGNYQQKSSRNLSRSQSRNHSRQSSRQPTPDIQSFL